VNPFQQLDVYSDAHLERYRSDPVISKTPHIYGVASRAYRDMIHTVPDSKRHADQSIIISGESGAGKTENTRHILEFLTYASTFATDKSPLSSNTGDALMLKIMASNIVLNSMGNAKTVRNDNSSR
jgi:myosin protein heavy chain